MQTFYKICLILLIVGGINWGLVGLFQFDFVGWLLGGSASIWSMPAALPAPPKGGALLCLSSRNKKSSPFGRAGASAPERVNDRCFCLLTQ